MSLKLPSAPQIYKSKAQISRVITEAWAKDNLYCPKCGGDLFQYPVNTAVKDFCCNKCQLSFQLKSQSRVIGNLVTGASYWKTAQAIINDDHPSLFLLHYDSVSHFVINVQLIHKACLHLDCFIKRNPLSPNARRHGFQGYTLVMSRVLRSGRIPIVYEGREMEKEIILQQWQSVERVMKVMKSLTGWEKEVMYYIDLLGQKFTLKDFEDQYSDWQSKYPNNLNIQAKIRQQLQYLRNKGLVTFKGQGHYLRNW